MEGIKSRRIIKSPYLLFLPFLVIYVVLICLFSDSGYVGDESRYIMFAENLLKGYYSPPPPALDLGNSPGYPILLAPFVAMNLPFLFIKLLNAVLYYFSIVLVFKALLQLVSYRFSVIFSLIWAFYPTFYELITFILPEVFAVFLVSLFLYTTIKIFKDKQAKNVKYIILSGLSLGYLILTKPVFGYVLLCMMALIIVLLIFNKKDQNYQKSLAVLLLAFFINIPYLIYTYHLSGKVFYWSSFGGNNLYWMTTPYEAEYGDWMGFPADSLDIYRIQGSEKIINANHQKDFDEILMNEEVRKANVIEGVIEYNLTKGFAQDDMFKKIAIRNIKEHPVKFLKNCLSNVGRMIFNYPVSYVPQKPSSLLRLPLNGTLVVLVLFCFIPTIMNWKKVIYPLRFLLFFMLLYFGGSIIGSADIRMFMMLVPFLLIWIAYTLSKSVRVSLHWNKP